MNLQPTNETQNPFNDLLEIYTSVTTFSHLELKVLHNCYYSLSHSSQDIFSMLCVHRFFCFSVKLSRIYN